MLTVLLLILMLSLQAWHPLGCLEEERIALLHLKHSLNYPNATSLPSWTIARPNCCDWDWERIGCNSSTGRVTELRLWGVRNQELGDWYLNASLFLPFQQLKALNLDGNSIAGWVEKKGGYELQKLSNLEFLDLRYNSFNNSILSFVESLPSLKSLYLDYNRLEGLIDLKESLSSLETLSLDGNNINKLIASRGPSNLRTLSLYNITTYGRSFQLLQSLGAFPNLTSLYLGSNDFRGRILGDGFLDLKNLKYLDLSFNTLNYSIFQTIRTMTSLKTLKLEACSLNGQIPTTQGFLDLKNLEYLDLSYNTLNNSIFQTIGTMTSLKTLKLEGCSPNGQIPTTQGFLDFKNLEHLDLSYTTLNNSIFQTIGTMTSLKTLQLGPCNLNGQIPTTQGKVYDTYF
ncbi:hypothetical protein NC651_039240 [Populus alba x Populus x berolinensis]|nr:hypothetical protein NC651_039240 [Populus alba x Populus x berolinensis]